MPLTERDVNIPPMIATQTPPAHKTPRPHSKLPRPVATPSTTPIPAEWRASITDRVGSAERISNDEVRSRGFKRDSLTASSAQKTPDTSLPAVRKSLLFSKPLPSRPVARFSNMLSPSKDSRGLIDASEKPLEITSTSGDKHEWPTLTPQPSRSATSTLPDNLRSIEQFVEPTSTTYATPLSMMAAATELTNTITGKSTHQHRTSTRSSHSPASSYVSATEDSSPINMSRKSSADAKEAQDMASNSKYCHSNLSTSSANVDFPARKASLRNRISNGNLITPVHGSRHHLMGFTDFTRADTASPVSTESRPHSPSPASFSRPRPGSVSSGSANSRAAKTASRIPIPDSKKATVVDVKKDSAPTPPVPKTSGLPTFGSRHLASPDALRILENGKMRRQLQRTPTNESSTSETQSKVIRSSDVTTTKTPSLSQSFDSSPEVTLTRSSVEYGTPAPDADHDYEISTPSDGLLRFPKSIDQKPQRATSPSGQQNTVDYVTFDSHTTVAVKAPPQSSPFAGPLPTIPSEAVLTINANDLNDGTKDQLVRTLSHLEGKGSPPKFDVDNQTLLQMFGHLKRGLKHNSRDSAALTQNAAAAEKFLAQRGSSTVEVKGLDRSTRVAVQTTPATGEIFTEEPATRGTIEKKNIASKWSASTPSDKAVSPPSEGIAPSHPEALSTQSPRLTARESWQEPVSIGHPYCYPARVTSLNPQTTDDAAPVASIRSRRSSPTLSKRRPGSVRAAREGLQTGIASFARTTASAESRKTLKLPTPSTRVYSVPEPSQRGRMMAVEKPRSKSEGLTASKVSRPSSKSRYVLNKINGLFSGKREKKSSTIPPVPRIEESNASLRGVDAVGNDSPTPEPARPVQPPKMSSLSPANQTGLRSASRVTMQTDDTTLVDSISMKDETQCVQALSEHLIGKARRELNPQRKERLLTFAKILNDSLISVREAAISAETAQNAAKSAQVYYEMTQRSLNMVQRLAASVARSGSHNRR